MLWILTLVFALNVSAQRAVLRSIDASSYPTMRATITAFDAAGFPVLPDSTRDRRVTDNGIRQTLGTFTYSLPTAPQPFSVTFLIDASSPTIPKALASAMRVWDDSVRVDHDAALVAFGALPYIVRDFSQTSRPLRDAVSRIPLLRSTDLTSALLDTVCGAIKVSMRDTRSRTIILVVAANSRLQIDSAFRALQNSAIRLCVVTVGTCASAALRSLALRTGGICIDSVAPSSITAGIRACVQICNGAPSTTIEWSNDPQSCANERDVRFDIRSLATELTHKYVVPDSVLRVVDIVPGIVEVDTIAVGDSVDIPVRVVTRGADVTVTDVRSDNSMCRLPAPIGTRVITRSAPLETTLRIKRTSSLEQRAVLSVQSNACRTQNGIVFTNGSTSNDIRPVLSTDLGGRRLQPFTTVAIAWTGLRSNDSVVFALSTDAGSTWLDPSPVFRTTPSAWAVPLVSSTQCLLLLRSLSRGTSDTSNLFTIESSNLPTRTVSFGTIRSDDHVRRVFSGIITNNRTTPLNIDSVRFSSQSILILRGEDCTVAPGGSWDCELQMYARSEGILTDTMSVFLRDEIVTIPVSATVKARTIQSPPSITINTTALGVTIDSIVSPAISLRRSSPVQSVVCSRVSRVVPDTAQFSIEALTVPFTLNESQSSRDVRVSYVARELGLCSSLLVVESDDGTEEVRLVGNTVCSEPLPETRITLPDTVIAFFGKTASIPVRFTPLPARYTAVVRPWTLSLRVPGSILFPAGSTPLGTVNGADRRITLTGSGFQRGDTLVTLDFTVALGITDQAPVLVESFRWNDDCSGVEGPIYGYVNVRNACTAGGLRKYLSGDSLFVVSVVPNPAESEAEVRVMLRETGPTSVELVDTFGRTLYRLPEVLLERGEHNIRIPVDSLNVGEYYVRILTPTAATTGIVKVVR